MEKKEKKKTYCKPTPRNQEGKEIDPENPHPDCNLTMFSRHLAKKGEERRML